MKGYIGCDADLEPGTVVTSGKNLELRIVILRRATEEEARESAASLGMPLDVVSGECFYEVDVTTIPVGGQN